MLRRRLSKEEETLELAKKYNPDCKFILEDAFNLDIKKDVVLSNQTLLLISPSKQDKFIEKHFELSNKYVVFFSLFTDSKLDINITTPLGNNPNTFSLFEIWLQTLFSNTDVLSGIYNRRTFFSKC